jgi:hypothetical protein
LQFVDVAGNLISNLGSLEALRHESVKMQLPMKEYEITVRLAAFNDAFLALFTMAGSRARLKPGSVAV